MVDEQLSAEEKAKIASSLLMHAPPCEFNEVFTDVRMLVDDDNLLKERVSGTFAQYNKEQFSQVKLDVSDTCTLITQHGDLGGGRFLCPRTHKSFRYDHLKREASDFSSAVPDNSANGSKSAEPWRVAVEAAVTDYVAEHYRNGPACTVYAPAVKDGIKLIVCIEAHYYKNQTSGRWRSEWTLNLPDNPTGGTAAIKGLLKIQTHLFEEGNVQLISSKPVDLTIKVKSSEQLAKDFVAQALTTEDVYQNAIGENFKTMSETTFKALRRQLPLTRSKIDWHKILGYSLGGQISRT